MAGGCGGGSASLAGGAVQGSVDGAGRFGALGGVLGDVGGDSPICQGCVGGGGGYLAYVDLVAPGQFAVSDGVGDDGEADAGGGGRDRFGEEGGGCPGGRAFGVAVGAVEADDRVEVDDAAFLVFGDLGERQA